MLLFSTWAAGFQVRAVLRPSVPVTHLLLLSINPLFLRALQYQTESFKLLAFRASTMVNLFSRVHYRGIAGGRGPSCWFWRLHSWSEV